MKISILPHKMASGYKVLSLAVCSVLTYLHPSSFSEIALSYASKRLIERALFFTNFLWGILEESFLQMFYIFLLARLSLKCGDFD